MKNSSMVHMPKRECGRYKYQGTTRKEGTMKQGTESCRTCKGEKYERKTTYIIRFEDGYMRSLHGTFGQAQETAERLAREKGDTGYVII